MFGAVKKLRRDLEIQCADMGKLRKELRHELGEVAFEVATRSYDGRESTRLIEVRVGELESGLDRTEENQANLDEHLAFLESEVAHAHAGVDDVRRKAVDAIEAVLASIAGVLVRLDGLEGRIDSLEAAGRDEAPDGAVAASSELFPGEVAHIGPAFASIEGCAGCRCACEPVGLFPRAYRALFG